MPLTRPRRDGSADATFHLDNRENGLLNTPGLSAGAGYVVNPSTRTNSVDGNDGSDWKIDHVQDGIMPAPANMGVLALNGVRSLRPWR